MKIRDELISALSVNVSVSDIRKGALHTGFLARYCGFAATLQRDALRQKGPLVKEPGFLLDKTPKEISRMACSDSILKAAIGMATIYSLLEVDLHSYTELNPAAYFVAGAFFAIAINRIKTAQKSL